MCCRLVTGRYVLGTLYGKMGKMRKLWKFDAPPLRNRALYKSWPELKTPGHWTIMWSGHYSDLAYLCSASLRLRAGQSKVPISHPSTIAFYGKWSQMDFFLKIHAVTFRGAWIHVSWPNLVKSDFEKLTKYCLIFRTKDAGCAGTAEPQCWQHIYNGRPKLILSQKRYEIGT